MSLSSHTFYGVIVIIMVFFGFFGNLAVFCTYARTSKLRKRHFFTLNLALMGLCLSLLYILPGVHHFMHIRMTGLACNAYAFITGVLAIGTIHQLAVMSIERYILISRPFLIRSARIWHRLLGTAVVYLTATLSVIPPVLGWSHYIPAEHAWYCGFDYESRTWEARSFLLYLFFLAYAVPLAIIVFAYSAMIYLLRRNESAGQGPLGRPPIGSFSSQISTSTASGQDMNRQIQVAKLMLMVIGVFLLSWTPYAIITFSYNFLLETAYPQVVVQLSALFAKMFVVFTPIVFGLRDKQLREFFGLISVHSPTLQRRNTRADTDWAAVQSRTAVTSSAAIPRQSLKPRVAV